MKRKIIGPCVVTLLFLVSMAIALRQETVARDSSVESAGSITAVFDPDIEIVWNTTWGGSGTDFGRSTWVDGNYVYLLGYTTSFGAGSSDFALVKFDVDGNQVWNTTWGGSGTEITHSIWSDGIYIYGLGYTNSFGAGGYDMLLVKWNATDGNEEWNKTWGTGSNEYGWAMWGDENYIYTYANGVPTLVKWNATDGNQIFTKTYSVAGIQSIWGDGSYIYLFGTTNSYNFIVYKIYPNGTVVAPFPVTWSNDIDSGVSIWGDGTYIYGLGRVAHPGINYDFGLVKWNATDGSEVWSRIWDGPDANDLEEPYSVWSDGAYIYTLGETGVWQSGYYNILLIKWDTAGNQLWNLTYGSGSYSYSGYSVMVDKNYIYAAGTTNHYDAGNFDFLLIKWGPREAPELEPTMITYEQNTTGHNIIWTATDGSPDTYVVCKNGSQIESGSWDGSPITTNIDGLLPGTYNYSIVFFDEFGLSSAQTVFVTVLSAGSPTLNSPADISYGTANPFGHKIIWIAGHNNPDYYIVYKNGSEYDSGIWNSAHSIVVNVDGFTKGKYNMTIVVYDAFGNSASDEVIVTVTPGQSSAGINVEEGAGLIAAAIEEVIAVIIKG